MNIEQLRVTFNEKKQYMPALFFILGFVFDIFTLGQIDDVVPLIQQSLYLILLGRLLYFQVLQEDNLWQPQHPKLIKACAAVERVIAGMTVKPVIGRVTGERVIMGRAEQVLN